MIAWLYKWLIGSFVQTPTCQHKWENIEQRDVVNEYNTRIGMSAYCKCEHCGEWKRFKMT